MFSNGNNSVTVYAASASGNVSPLGTIEGSNTGLGAPLGIAVDQNDKIYVANNSNNSVTIYDTFGNVKPTSFISGANTGLDAP